MKKIVVKPAKAVRVKVKSNVRAGATWGMIR
jgi:hypothetical protein